MAVSIKAPLNVDYSSLLTEGFSSGGSAAPNSGMGNFMSMAGPVMSILGAIQSGYGAFASARSVKSNLEFQSDMAAINARRAEKTAQSIMRAGEEAQGQISLKAGKVKSAQKVSQGARGVQVGVGSAAEEIATTDMMKETDMMTINANTVRQAWEARMGGTNYANESLLKGTSADSINPYMSTAESLLTSATTVASSWYRDRRINQIADAMGVK